MSKKQQRSAEELQVQVAALKVSLLKMAETVEALLPIVKSTCDLTGEGSAWLSGYRLQAKQARKMAKLA